VSGFSAFVVSAIEDLVDSSKDPDTLFEKIRFQLRLTPSWMLPKGFNLLRDLNHMNIANPENGATITGGAPTENVGRQRRATVVVADEFQGWPNGGFKQNIALSQTAFSIIKLGTPYGTFNQYYVDTHTPNAKCFSFRLAR
jgi:phage terminase large subunit